MRSAYDRYKMETRLNQCLCASLMIQFVNVFLIFGLMIMKLRDLAGNDSDSWLSSAGWASMVMLIVCFMISVIALILKYLYCRD